MTAVAATGPVVFTDPTNGRQQTIPISQLYFSNTDGSIKADHWAPYNAGNGAFKNGIDGWLKYLVTGSILSPFEKSEPAAAMVLTAKDPGANGNSIEITVSNVHETAPDVFAFDAAVKEHDAYTALTAATIRDVLGTTSGGGTQPGLVFVSSAGVPVKPKGGTYPLAGDPAKVDVDNSDESGVAFTLTAKSAGADGALTSVFITEPDGNDKFDLTADWEKSEANLAPANVQTKFAYEVTVAPPDGGSLGVPAAGTTVLSGGADKAAAVKAKATLPGNA
jgi:hypothetical protein